MQALRLLRDVPGDRALDLHVKVPKRFGGRVEVIVLPATAGEGPEEEREGRRLTDDEGFLASSYWAVGEDDSQGGAVWSEYLK